MKNFLMIAALVFLSLAADAQTRRIAHRFHSGTNTERFGNGDGSYGGPYIPMKRIVKVDTVYDEVRKDSVVRLVDSSYWEMDTSMLHQSHIHENLNDVRDYGKICSRYTGK
jgi:hypothetical protein